MSAIFDNLEKEELGVSRTALQKMWLNLVKLENEKD